MPFSGFVQAQAYGSGVEPGMVFDYTLNCYWESSDPGYSEIPTDLLVYNFTSYVEVIISETNHTHVTVANPWYFKDGTSYLERGAVNILTGDGYGFEGIIAANLKVGDLVHPSGKDGLKILDTKTRNYGGSTNRETNHIRIDNDDKISGTKGTRDLYFDKETGILVEQNDKTETTRAPFITSQVTWKLAAITGVDNWTISDTLPTNQVLLIGVIVVIVVAAVAIFIIVYKKKIAKPKATV
jgi:hypothetical protein